VSKSDTASERAVSLSKEFLGARKGSREALGRLLETCRPYLLLVANNELDRDLQAKAGASDLVQETFIEPD
jgi:RNA polymerase sigma-70 factor (ECF subfamily)